MNRLNDADSRLIRFRPRNCGHKTSEHEIERKLFERVFFKYKCPVQPSGLIREYRRTRLITADNFSLHARGGRNLVKEERERCEEKGIDYYTHTTGR